MRSYTILLEAKSELSCQIYRVSLLLHDEKSSRCVCRTVRILSVLLRALENYFAHELNIIPFHFVVKEFSNVSVRVHKIHLINARVHQVYKPSRIISVHIWSGSKELSFFKNILPSNGVARKALMAPAPIPDANEW